jgi:hypothetical protein
MVKRYELNLAVLFPLIMFYSYLTDSLFFALTDKLNLTFQQLYLFKHDILFIYGPFER